MHDEVVGATQLSGPSREGRYARSRGQRRDRRANGGLGAAARRAPGSLRAWPSRRVRLDERVHDHVLDTLGLLVRVDLLVHVRPGVEEVVDVVHLGSLEADLIVDDLHEAHQPPDVDVALDPGAVLVP